MKLVIITIGKPKNKACQELINDYISRIPHYMPLELIAVKEEGRLSEKLSKDDYVLLCDEHGKEYTSVELAEYLVELQNRGIKRLTFVVGDAEGFGDKIRKRSDESIALSRLTLQHEMAAAILAEQLYRACTIIKGEPYHK
ncbi:23S rRNA (pseudouridine(1915)-N(3))-methyltransferase RlmH [bacterium]|nr:23S rRNA (pseudouridine(1915)-N(3))-methyltransferase RlmH [bacterium]